MLNLAQPRLPTPTVFDGTTPTFPEWARELRACLNISQFEHIDLLDFADDAEDPLTTDIMVQQTPAKRRQRTETVCLTQAQQDLRDERALPQGDAARRENAVIDNEIQQITQDLSASQVPSAWKCLQMKIWRFFRFRLCNGKASKFSQIFFRICFCSDHVGYAQATTAGHAYK